MGSASSRLRFIADLRFSGFSIQAPPQSQFQGVWTVNRSICPVLCSAKRNSVGSQCIGQIRTAADVRLAGIRILSDLCRIRRIGSLAAHILTSSISSSMKSTVWIDCRYCLPYIVGIRFSILVRCRKILPGIGPPVRFRTGSCSLL